MSGPTQYATGIPHDDSMVGEVTMRLSAMFLRSRRFRNLDLYF